MVRVAMTHRCFVIGQTEFQGIKPQRWNILKIVGQHYCQASCILPVHSTNKSGISDGYARVSQNHT